MNSTKLMLHDMINDMVNMQNIDYLSQNKHSCPSRLTFNIHNVINLIKYTKLAIISYYKLWVTMIIFIIYVYTIFEDTPLDRLSDVIYLWQTLIYIYQGYKCSDHP